MRFSCNGCRVLRKGCSEDCSLRPCLEWLSSPESQANATVFLSKFYGRHGLINLINAAPPHLRPEIFRSLLYEACGRVINPVYGSVGLMSSGDWPRCQAAVEAVLGGRAHFVKQVAATCDISKDSATAFHPRNRRKRSASQADSEAPHSQEAKFTITGWDQESKREDDSSSVEPSLVKFDEHPILESPQLSEMGLDLTLGFNPDPHTYLSAMRDF